MGQHGLQVGTPDVRSVGPITFGPDGILFVADNASATGFAVDVADLGVESARSEPFELDVRGRKIRIWRRPARTATVTDMSYVDGMLLVAGMSNEEFASNLRRIPFPFTGEMGDNSLEIFHVSHGKWETAAPIKSFVPYEKGRSILASYTCRPVVHFPIADITVGTRATGRTVA